MLLRFDEIVGRVPAFRYQESREKMLEFARSALQSPLPGSRIREVWPDTRCEMSESGGKSDNGRAYGAVGPTT